MGKVAVIYQSKYGSTKKYAQWIAEELKADLYQKSQVTVSMLKQYETIVYGGGLYAGGIAGFSLIKKNLGELGEKRIVVFAVGATSENTKAEEEVKKRNLTDSLADFPFFMFRGGLNYPEMKLIDRLMMAVMVASIKRKKEADRNNDDKGILATYGKKVDFTDRKAIAPLIALLKG